MPAWLIAVLVVLAVAGIVRYCVHLRYKRAHAIADSLPHLFHPHVRRGKLYDR